MAEHRPGRPMGEFELIARYFTWPTGERQGVGDDCALIDVGDRTLAITCDLLNEGVHFAPGADPHALGHKALAVNLSDLAAAGARPRCFVLGLALPGVDASWLEAFSAGLFALADQHHCVLVGGDTTRSMAGGGAGGAGPVGISITAMGEVDRTRYCGRGGARAGDDIWLSGCTGEAALALAGRMHQAEVPGPWRQHCERRLDRPDPRVDLGLALAGVATACLDVSDGLLGDLRHILERSGVGAVVDWGRVPLSPALAQLDVAVQQRFVLAGGDDYELLFTARADQRDRVERIGQSGVALTRIGVIQSEPGLRLRNGGAPEVEVTLGGYDHFATGHRSGT